MANSPISTYRLQLNSDFTFRDAAAQADYFASLGVTHPYLSPILQATPGSTHGYDVTDPTRVSADLGGDEGLAELGTALRNAGLRPPIVDIVPNHMTVPTPLSLNQPLTDVFRNGPDSAYARWWDIDWRTGQIVRSVLSDHLATCLDAGEIRVDRSGPEPVLRYYEHELPLREGTADLPLLELLAAQYYRLAYWRTGNEDLNYRRFFDVDTLAGVRVEDPEVFRATHSRSISLVRDGVVDGFRIDHPDGLADPAGYLARLARSTGGIYTVAEKILEGEEQLPEDWETAGTTGYDAAARIGRLLTDPDGIPALTDFYVAQTGAPADFDVVVEKAKRATVTILLKAEVARLLGKLDEIRRADPLLADYSSAGLREALIELFVAFPVYRAYVTPGIEPPPESVRIVIEAVARAKERLPESRHATVDLLGELALGRKGRSADLDEFVVRFQQTCGPVMAKSVEDTAFYRWVRLLSANEVGADPAQPTMSSEDFLRWAEDQQERQPLSMTTLSTHDTKRSEDVRARIAVLSEVPEEWKAAVGEWQQLTAAYRPAELDGNTEYLLWQTLVGARSIPADRLTAYLEKATREAKEHTTWTEPNAAYDQALAGFARRVLEDPRMRESIERFVASVAPYARAKILSQKQLQLMLPGVADVYQGTEFTTDSLVDPDNRRPVDYAARREALSRLDAGAPPANLDEEKLLVVSRALRLRRDIPDAFIGPDASVDRVESSDPHAFAMGRSGEVVSVVTRFAAGLERQGGWRDATVNLPAGLWNDVLTGRKHEGGLRPTGELLGSLPVALLHRTDGPGRLRR